MTDELTLRRAQKGDPQAFEALMTPLEDQIWRLCYHYMGNREDAQDAAQDTMLKAWRSIGQFRGDSKLETWLYRLCVSCCLDALRKRKIRQVESTDALQEAGFDPKDEKPLPEEEVIHRERRRALRQALNQLPEDQRTALILSAVQGRSYEDIAGITGTAMGTVKSRINRARSKLLSLMNSGEQTGSAPVQGNERRAK